MTKQVIDNRNQSEKDFDFLESVSKRNKEANKPANKVVTIKQINTTDYNNWGVFINGLLIETRVSSGGAVLHAKVICFAFKHYPDLPPLEAIAAELESKVETCERLNCKSVLATELERLAVVNTAIANQYK